MKKTVVLIYEGFCNFEINVALECIALKNREITVFAKSLDSIKSEDGLRVLPDKSIYPYICQSEFIGLQVIVYYPYGIVSDIYVRIYGDVVAATVFYLSLIDNGVFRKCRHSPRVVSLLVFVPYMRVRIVLFHCFLESVFVVDIIAKLLKTDYICVDRVYEAHKLVEISDTAQ